MEQEGGPVRIVIAHDHLIVREGLRLILEEQADFEVVGEAQDGMSALRLIDERRPKIVLMDLQRPGMKCLEAVEQIRRCWPHVAVIVLTTYDDDELMMKSLHAGAVCYLVKDTKREALYEAIRRASRGEMLMPTHVMRRLLTHNVQSKAQGRGDLLEITEREREVLAGVARGQRNKEIAYHLSISASTVKSHLGSIYGKLGVDSRASAVAVAIERKQIDITRR